MSAGPPPPPAVPFAVPVSLQVVDSTNRYLADLVRTGLADGSPPPAGYAVVAEQQSAGRGRFDRRWEAPFGSAVLCSILFWPEVAIEQLHLTAWAVALAAVQACRDLTGVELSIKWPNDLLAGERKVAGILSEIVPVGPTSTGPDAPRRPPAVVVGLGLNLNWPSRWPPEDAEDTLLASIAARATALNRVVGHEIDRKELTARLLQSAGRWNQELASEQGRLGLATAYRRTCSTIGCQVRVELPDETIVGTALDIDDAGSLLVASGACLRTVAAGDVVHVR